MLTIIVIVLPPLALLAVGGWLVSLCAFHRSSVASLITALIVPIFANKFYPDLLLPLTALSAVVYIRHRSNIANILQAKEPIIGKVKIETHS